MGIGTKVDCVEEDEPVEEEVEDVDFAKAAIFGGTRPGTVVRTLSLANSFAISSNR